MAAVSGAYVATSHPYIGPGGGASPNGYLYPNGAVATGFAIGTPYQPFLPSRRTTWVPQPTTSPQPHDVYADEESLASLRAVHAYRGSQSRMMNFDPHWDDAELLTEMRKTYDKLRSWRRWCSLKNVRSVTMISSRDKFVYPQRIGPARVSSRQHMRFRFFLNHPEKLRGSRDLMGQLMSRPGVGIEFVERWQAKRLTFAVIGLVFLSLIVSLTYAWITRDVSTAFSIGSYMTSAFSVIVVLVGILGLVDL
ncbi:uncharacterized protein B0H18DRAFT_873437 [Fomitopsis serialis]|uniref:uncharacterized protein n=1 Tax=Fomitopsis serialis TaxID=139415 RepID=UPI002007BEAC|nr:uncharacterized protein B0H18DRAFT_873437 [Neoantrodia serialis]KAH9930161.1 hypothetical protein B0H18DRAFT_873437 [Neoantrodia serialis]